MNSIQKKIFLSFLLVVFTVLIVLGFVVMNVIFPESITQRQIVLLIVSIVVAGLVIVLFGVRITSEYTKPVVEAIWVTNELAKGNYHVRIDEDPSNQTGILCRSINVLASNLEKMWSQQQINQDRLRTLIEIMGSGLLVIDDKGYINLVNGTYKRTFDVEDKEYVNHLYHDVLQHKELTELVEKIFMTEKRVRKQLHLPLKIERRHFEVYGTPIIGANEEWKGVVLVFHDITKFKKLEQMRKDFVANVSHELKTPLTSIKGFSETLLDGAANDLESRDYFLKIVLKETERMLTLINDLLDLSKIEQEGFQLNIRNVDLREILKEVCVMLQSKADAKKIALNFELDHNEPLFMEGDQLRLKQVFINLIDNAINYSLPNGVVFLRTKQTDANVIVHIADTGHGISSNEIPRIFERFYRVDKARSRESGGTGLGLAIVKHLVEAHNGKIDVKSEINKGTLFTITFPKHN